MIKVPISQAQEGMELSSPVLDERKQVLCSTGTKLSLNDINWLKSIGIQNVMIEGYELKELKDVDPHIKELQKKFNADDIKTLKSKIKDYIAAQFQPIKSSLRQEILDKCVHYYYVQNDLL